MYSPVQCSAWVTRLSFEWAQNLSSGQHLAGPPMWAPAPARAGVRDRIKFVRRRRRGSRNSGQPSFSLSAYPSVYSCSRTERAARKFDSLGKQPVVGLNGSAAVVASASASAGHKTNWLTGAKSNSPVLDARPSSYCSVAGADVMSIGGCSNWVTLISNSNEIVRRE